MAYTCKIQEVRGKAKLININVMNVNRDRIYFLGIQFFKIFLFAYITYIRFPMIFHTCVQCILILFTT